MTSSNGNGYHASGNGNGTCELEYAAGLLPPNNKEAEEALIGSALIDNDVLMQVQLSPHEFYSRALGDVWAAMLDLARAGRPVDYITLDEVLSKREAGMTIIELMGFLSVVPTSINAPHYAAIIRANSQRRQLLYLARKLENEATKDTPVEMLISEAETGLIAIRQQERPGGLMTAKVNASQFLTALQSDAETAVPSYYLDFDRVTGGLEAGSVYWFCAAEKMGKTAFVSRISLQNALAHRVVVRFSLEMSARQRTRRDVAMITKIPINRLRKRELSEYEMNQAFAAAGRLSELSLIIDETPGTTPSQIRATLNRVLMDYGRVDLVEVDYFQLGEVDEPTKNRVADLETFSRQLAHIAREYRVPVIGTAQVLSKSIEQRADKRPYLSDVFGSSALAKDGYLVAFLYRDEYYNPDTTEMPGMAELIIRAHRDGSTAVIDLAFHGPTAEYRDMARPEMRL